MKYYTSTTEFNCGIDLHARRLTVQKEQLARNLTDPVDGFLRHCKLLLHDRDSLFTGRFDSIG
jgi:hypothetical protein